MKVLGIETSCDETAAAVVENGDKILSSVVATQIDLHSRFGGVVPEIACRAHVECIIKVIDQALSNAGLSLKDIDLLAVTYTPGLIGALLIGISTAKALSWSYRIPLVGVNHLAGHLYAAKMEHPDLEYPFIGLVASGGHTSLFMVKNPIELQLLGETTDDAAGEAMDKAASILGLGYPGGPLIEKASRGGNPDAIDFPRSYLGKESLNFSFSGLKTALLYYCLGKNTKKGTAVPKVEDKIADITASFQEAVVDMLVTKTLRAVTTYRFSQVGIAGGVACNKRLREKMFNKGKNIKVFFPSPSLCTDNAVMIAGLGFHLAQAGKYQDLSLDASS